MVVYAVILKLKSSNLETAMLSRNFISLRKYFNATFQLYVIVIARVLGIYGSKPTLDFYRSLATVLSLLYIPPDWSAQRRRSLHRYMLPLVTEIIT